MGFGLLQAGEQQKQQALQGLRTVDNLKQNRDMMNKQIDQQDKANTMSSVASGAAMGFMVGGPIGGAIGAGVGLLSTKLF